MRLIIESQTDRQEFSLAEGRHVVGREAACDVRFADASLSRQHLEVIIGAREARIRDLNSKNGLFLGGRKVHELHVPPKTRFRAGNVWMHFEIEAGEQPGTSAVEVEPAAKTAPTDAPPPEDGALEAMVPTDAQYSADDEPTPADDISLLRASEQTGAQGSRMIERAGHWYVRDIATGDEVEVVPDSTGVAASAQAAAGLPAVLESGKGGAVVGATLRRRGLSGQKRKLLMLLGAAAAALILILLGVAVFGRERQAQPMSLQAYRAAVENAVAQAKDGKMDTAEARLVLLLNGPIQGVPTLARMLLQAVQADMEAQKDFERGHERASDLWEEVRDSSHSSEAARALATSRHEYFLREGMNLAHVNDARRLLAQNDLAGALKAAASVSQDSIFRKDADPLFAQALDAIIAGATQKARAAEQAGNWNEAIQNLRDVIKQKPDLASTLDPKIAALQRCEADRQLLDQAKQLMQSDKFADATARLAAIGADSPYATDAEALRNECAGRSAGKQAAIRYAAGDGEGALIILRSGNQMNSLLARKIQRVLAARKLADDARKEARFADAVSALQEIQHQEPDATNAYHQEAQRQIAGMGEFKRAMAQQIAEEGEAAFRAGDWGTARDRYEQAAQLDKENTTADKGQKLLKSGAVLDFNSGLQLRKSDPARARQLFESVKARVPSTDTYYGKAEAELRNLEAGAQKSPAAEPTP